MQEGFGAYLIKHPEIIKDMVQQTVSRVGGFPVSIKIRVHKDTRYKLNKIQRIRFVLAGLKLG